MKIKNNQAESGVKNLNKHTSGKDSSIHKVSILIRSSKNVKINLFGLVYPKLLSKWAW